MELVEYFYPTLLFIYSIIKQLQGAEQIIMDFGKPSQPVTVKSLTVTVHLSNNKVCYRRKNLSFIYHIN